MTSSPTSTMLAEARAAPEVVRAQLATGEERYRGLGAALRASPPAAIATIARGSSDHAAHFFADLATMRTGVLAASLEPSLVTLHQRASGAAGSWPWPSRSPGGAPISSSRWRSSGATAPAPWRW